MRKCVILGMMISLSFLAGCGNGVVTTKADRTNAFKQSVDMDIRQMADDWDSLWLVDRQYRLTRWQTR